jgi:hypothetical protein
MRRSVAMRACLLGLLGLVAVGLVACGDDPLTHSSVQCQSPGDTVTVVRCGDDDLQVPAVPD